MPVHTVALTQCAAAEILAPAPAPLLLTDGSPPRRQHFLLFVLLGLAQLGLLLLLLVSYLFSGLHAVCLWLASFDHFALTGGLWLALAFGLWLWMSHAYWIDSGGKRAGVAAGISLLPVAFLWWLAPHYLRFDNWAAGLSAGYRHGFAAHWLLTGLGIAGLLVCDFYWLRGGTGRLSD